MLLNLKPKKPNKFNKSLLTVAFLAIISLCAPFRLGAHSMRTDHIYQHQVIFTQNIARLTEYIFSKGYKCTLGESFRTHEQALWNAQKHIGVVNSNHCYRLAIDLNLFDSNDKYLHDSKEYTQFGEYWEKLNPFNEWGGRWKNGDSNHFEMD